MTVTGPELHWGLCYVYTRLIRQNSKFYMKYGQYIGYICQSTVTLCFLYRRHSELRSESDRKVASLEGRLEATIRKYETELHNLQMENERLKSGAAAAEHRDNGKDTFLVTSFGLRADFYYCFTRQSVVVCPWKYLNFWTRS